MDQRTAKALLIGVGAPLAVAGIAIIAWTVYLFVIGDEAPYTSVHTAGFFAAIMAATVGTLMLLSARTRL
jgi:hypothetical protein